MTWFVFRMFAPLCDMPMAKHHSPYVFNTAEEEEQRRRGEGLATGAFHCAASNTGPKYINK